MKYNVKLIYISTDHVYKGDRGNYKEDSELLPFNKYGWSKLGGECAVQMYDNSLILRISMCEEPFPHPRALCDVKKSLVYHRDAAKIVLHLLEEVGIINVGGETSTIYDFVKKENSEILKIKLNEITDVNMMRDTSINIEKMKRVLNKK
jgi:dTDP-4-dehydrorhamnose reductase